MIIFTASELLQNLYIASKLYYNFYIALCVYMQSVNEWLSRENRKAYYTNFLRGGKRK